MSNLSVKLDETTHARLKTLAAREGMTPHALMVQAIGSQLDDIEARHSFVERALQAQAQAEAGGPVYDGPAYADYLRAKARAGMNEEGSSVKKPTSTTLVASAKQRKSRA
jgi:predicted transcriptional regulator